MNPINNEVAYVKTQNKPKSPNFFIDPKKVTIEIESQNFFKEIILIISHNQIGTHHVQPHRRNTRPSRLRQRSGKERNG